MPNLYKNTKFMMNICLFSGSLEFGCVLMQKKTTCPAPTKHGVLGLWWASLANSMSYMLSQLVAGKIKHILCDSTGKILLEACSWFPLDFAPCAFALWWLFFVFFFFYNKSQTKYKYMLSSVSTSSESIKLGESLGTPEKACNQVLASEN